MVGLAAYWIVLGLDMMVVVYYLFNSVVIIRLTCVLFLFKFLWLCCCCAGLFLVLTLF